MVSYVVTGANRGIGLEFVRQLSARDENVVFALVRSKAKAAKLEGLGRANVHVLEADIVDRDALQAAAKEVASVTGGTLDVLINNAAFVGDGREMLGISTYPPEVENKVGEDLVVAFNINVVGTVNATNAFLPLLRSSNSNGGTGSQKKKVITISSAAGDLDFTRKVGDEALVPYSVSKAALNMVVLKYALAEKNLKKKRGAEGKAEEEVMFLALNPGAVDTLDREGMDAGRIEGYEKLVEGIVVKLRKAEPTFERLATPESSVRMMLEVIEKVGPEESGAFLSHHGNNTQWL